MEVDLAHPIFAPVAALLGTRGGEAPGLGALNALAERENVRTAGGRPVRFVRPSTAPCRYGEYELRVFETGQVETREGNRHDLFNALAWLAYPLTKARINALHAAEIPVENGRRGRLRDLLTLFDEGGAIVRCSDARLIALVREHRWIELFWDRRSELSAGMRVEVIGHAVLERAAEPWPGITCKALIVDADHEQTADAGAAAWLAALPAGATPALLPPLPVFGLPGWHPQSGRRAFYEDRRYFRPLRPAGTMLAGVGRAAAVRGNACAQRKVRAPQSGMQGNALARQRDE